ncbi:hypothetical protein ABEB36_007305 [Hypothenemus hampei]|uniref:HTH psq-type domain-containing protein n=1 Tax=Hypothenemus hampei TaxID=57062 RepID=A0ABD1ETI9_HYPHA
MELCRIKIAIKDHLRDRMISEQYIMVGKYHRKSNRLQWQENDMSAAIQAVSEGKMGWFLASKTFGVPFGTLRRRYQGTNKFTKDTDKSYMGVKDQFSMLILSKK